MVSDEWSTLLFFREVFLVLLDGLLLSLAFAGVLFLRLNGPLQTLVVFTVAVFAFSLTTLMTVLSFGRGLARVG